MSGINAGSNVGDEVSNSGTVAAACEGAVRGINSIALSQYGGNNDCLLYTSPSPRDGLLSRMPSSA